MWEDIKAELGSIETWEPNEPIEVGAHPLGRLLTDAEALLSFKRQAQKLYREHRVRIDNGLDVPVPINEWLAALPAHLREQGEG